MNLREILAGGQDRRAKLDEGLGKTLNYYLGPTGIPQRLSALGILNPVNDLEQAGQKAKTVFSPDATGRERFNAGVGMATDMATVAAPIYGASKVGSDGAAAVVEALTGMGGATREGLQDAGRRFAGSEAGNMALGADSKADAVARLLREGRASEITDDMMGALDPNDQMRLARLYEDGATGVPMPMDEASRMARAREMGFDTQTPLYHGTGADFQSFDAQRFGQSDHGAKGRGVYASQDPDLAGSYATLVAEDGRQVYPINYGLSNPYDGEIPTAMYDEGRSVAFTENLKNAGFDGVMRPNARRGGEFTEAVAFDPTNIRSRFARFDPRLKHLANLSASGAAAAPLSALLANYEQTDEQRKLRDYLQQ